MFTTSESVRLVATIENIIDEAHESGRAEDLIAVAEALELLSQGVKTHALAIEQKGQNDWGRRRNIDRGNTDLSDARHHLTDYIRTNQ